MKIGKLLWVSNKFEGKKDHNAFTDVKRFGEIFFLAFRTGEEHIKKRDGKIKVFTAVSKINYFMPAHFPEMKGDMRDPHIFEYEGRPAVIFALINNETPSAYISSMGEDGKFGKPFKFKDEFVPWRPIKYKGQMFFPGYHHGKEANKISRDIPKGIVRQKMGSRVYVEGKKEIICKDPSSNETELFEYGGELYAIVRMEGRKALLFKRDDSKKEWSILFNCGRMLQGPCVKVVGDRIFVVGRDSDLMKDYYDNKDKLIERVIMQELDLKKGSWGDFVNIISGINLDAGYAGLEVMEDNKLMMSFYAGNEMGANVFVFEVAE